MSINQCVFVQSYSLKLTKEAMIEYMLVVTWYRCVCMLLNCFSLSTFDIFRANDVDNNRVYFLFMKMKQNIGMR